MLKLSYVIVIFTLYIATSILSANASEMQPELLPPEDQQYRDSEQDIKIKFPFDILENITTQLALEVDAVDVSSMVSVDGDLITFSPPSPLVPGVHQMRLVEYAENGDIIELGNWSFEIRQSAAFREQQLALGVTINNSYLVASDYSNGAPAIDEYSSNGAATINYKASNENHAINFTGDLLYVEDQENTARGEQVDLGQYLLGVDIGKNAHFDVGHHAINHNSLIYNNFNRRGISGQFKLPSANSSIQVFSSRTGDLQGFTKGLGVEDSNNRTSGLVLDYQPFSNDPEQLTISTSYVYGKRKDTDFTMGMLVEESSGDATSFALDSQLLNRALRIRLEAAQSTFDFDGSSPALDKESDNAYRFITQYSAQPIGNSETPLLWNISLEKVIVEPSFYSLSNSYLVSDRDFTQLISNISKGSWSSQLFINKESDNIDNRFTSTNNSTAAGIIIDYSSANVDKASFLGTPQYRLTYNQAKQDQDGVELDELLVPLPVNDTKTTYLELFSEFVYEKNNSWSILASDETLTSNPLIEPDSSIQTFEISGNYNINQQHSISSSITSLITEEDASNLRNKELIYHLEINSHYKRLDINTQFSIDYEAFEGEISGPPNADNNRWSFGAAISKQLAKPKNLFPGIDLQIRGSYSQIDDRSTFNDDSDFYEIFMDLNFYWDVQRPQLANNL